MPASAQKKLLRTLRHNWQSGITVALVSVPLSLSLAIASGASPITGIITAMWAGLVSAIFCSSAYNVIGPAGALSGILLAFTQQFGTAALPALAVVSGAGILLFWALRWDRYLVFVPSSVMHGFTLGVALIIGLNQINFAFNLQNVPSHTHFIENVWASLTHLGGAHLPSTALTLMTVALLFAIVKLAPRVPGAIVVAVLGIILGKLSTDGVVDLGLQTLQQKYGTFQGSLFAMPAFDPAWLTSAFFRTAVTVTIVAVLETLLSAKIAGIMTHTKFSESREVFGLGLANVASGLAGGLPATGVLARTALNVKTGGTSRLSSGINALAVGLISLLLFGWFQYLPLPVVAGILIVAAIRMVETEHFLTLLRFDLYDFLLALVVAVLTVAIDPLAGLMVGAVVALLIAVRRLSRGQREITLHHKGALVARLGQEKQKREKKGKPHTHQYDTAVYRIAGELNYFNSLSHAEAIARLKADTLILSLRNLFAIDIDGFHALKDMVQDAEKTGTTVYLTGAPAVIRHSLEKTEWYQKLEKQKRVFESTTLALKYLEKSLH